MKKVLLLLVIGFTLAGCSALPKEATWEVITSVENCRNMAGVDVCDVTLANGVKGFAEKEFI